jgi:hypothetical protein
VARALTPAQRHGVGAACSADSDCFVADAHLRCLPFKGGYCGLEGCQQAADCPPGSACVTHDDGNNYCFLLCVDKPECNYTRPPEIEANCSSKITFADGSKEQQGLRATELTGCQARVSAQRGGAAAAVAENGWRASRA